ncbi:bifunctional tRNA pseudouridine(32) synthase/23S rRNA pseudouridine(746) synthase RluA [Alteromonas halophila]|uniref:Pseudouridine synthase n=1 Tax=Alteromonas halophila TaxID=516698 RepID=A0A918JGR3_9ALTE|nr:bifunctional tRNA pseudouridine(32) synthase/23S rRNA pseudouridine(746) synthase RluA [Alteromonas halophila]GGW80086.1 pseudouridine synthase [Alteromonas halophila]
MVNPEFVYNPPPSPLLPIIYQDDDILVVDKPSGLLSVPGRRAAHYDSMATRAQRVFPTASIVHRLDMATSGLLILAMNKAANSELSRQFRERIPKKRYYARVDGQIRDDEGEVTEPLIVDWPNRPKQKICYESGKAALTQYRVIQRDTAETLVELHPVTGRSHQLRVHMLALGHPILGDRLYASSEAKARAPRLQLHAQTLIVQHPVAGNWMHFCSTLPFSDYQPAQLTTDEQ